MDKFCMEYWEYLDFSQSEPPVSLIEFIIFFKLQIVFKLR